MRVLAWFAVGLFGALFLSGAVVMLTVSWKDLHRDVFSRWLIMAVGLAVSVCLLVATD